MKPAKDAGRPSALAVNPRNRKASAARRSKLLAAFLALGEDTQADLLELTEDIAFTAGDARAKRNEIREIIRRMYAIAGWPEEYHG